MLGPGERRLDGEPRGPGGHSLSVTSLSACSDGLTRRSSGGEQQIWRVNSAPEYLVTLRPRLVVGDGAAAVAFYRRAFGAEERGERVTGPDGDVIHAEVEIGASVIMVTEAPDPEAPARSPDAVAGVVTAIMALSWQDVDTAWERAVAAGAEVIYPLADHSYGDRAGRLRDPFGQQWMMSRRIDADGGPSDLFVPRGPCRVETASSVWMIDPDPMGGGRYAAIPWSSAPSGFDWALSAGEWMRYDWIRLWGAGSARRFAIRPGRAGLEW